MKTFLTESQSRSSAPVQAEGPGSPGAIPADDISAFGPAAALALTELPRHIAALNRTYRHLVSERALWMMPAVATWRHHTVNVFLRHDAVYVFAIHHHPHVGMANFVDLRNASFVVDATGRNQTLRKTGTLPNSSTVHAYVAGELTAIGDEPLNSVTASFPELSYSTDLPHPELWHPVYYRPDRDSQFMTSLLPTTAEGSASLVLQPVHTAARVRMIPGRIKVWCQQPNCPQVDSNSSARSGEGL